MHQFNINTLDHVAIRVKNMEKSIQWYNEVLGLKTYRVPKWKNFPIFLLSGKTGVALFPANVEDPVLNHQSHNVKIDHYAFNVSNLDFAKARKHYDSLGLSYDFQDHYYFHSIYTRDPDGHVVELTTLVVSEDEFYDL